MSEVIVIGAGVGGLTAAYYLNKAGVQTTVLEASDRPGGRVVTLERNGDYVDIGAQILHSSYTVGDQLMTEIGIRDQWRPIDGRQMYLVDGKDPWIQESGSPFIKPLGIRGNLGLYHFILKNILFGRRQRLHQIDFADRLDDVSVEAYFAQSTNPLLTDYLLPSLCSAMNVASPDFTSMQHLLHIFRITAFTKMFGLPEGLEQFPRTLATRVPVEYNSPVREIISRNGRTEGVILADGTKRHARHIVLATAPHHAADLLPDELSEQRNFFETILAIPQDLPILYLDRPLEPGVFSYIGDPRTAGYFWFALDTRYKVPEMVPSGKSIITLWSQYPQTSQLSTMSDGELLDLAAREAGALIPGFSKSWIEHGEVFHHTFSHPPYGPGSYKKVLNFKKKANSLRGLSFVGDVFGGAYIEASLRSAASAVKQVRTELSC